jgi:DnaJ homolog subfamily C member 3
MLKRAGMKDYYKILEVSRTATQKEIKKAYRKKAQEWHPDKYSGDLTKEDVEKKMADINAAYEVLRNEETRERYDQGHDPNVIFQLI